jgi:hypothetical protein
MDTRDIYKLVRELSEERDDIVNLYDSMDIELSEDFVIETGVVGFTKDGVIVHLDEDAMEMLDLNGILLESEEAEEAIDESFVNEDAEQLDRMVTKAAGTRNMKPGDLQWARKEYARQKEAEKKRPVKEDAVDSFKNKLSRSTDPFEMIYDAISGNYGDEIRDAMQEMYDDVVNDSGYRLHPDDDFEKIIEIVVDQLVDDSEDYKLDEISDIKRLAGQEEVDEGLGKALLGGAALIAAITGVNKMEANHLMKTEPQLIALAQMHQEAVKQGDEYKVKELEDRIEKTLDHISVTGRPVMDIDGKPIDPREPVGEAEYQGRKVPLGKPMQGDVKKSKVYVKKPNGKVVKVNFGDKNMKIKKSNPARRKSFRARHNCDNPGPRWKARYWSCRAW